MQSPDNRQAADVSAGAAGADLGRDAPRQAALAVIAWWHAVSAALAPVLGLRGVAALYQRTLHVAAGRHEFLANAHSSGTEPDLPALQDLLAQQGAPAIRAASVTLSATLFSLLEGLVGSSLTERLLHDVQAPITGGDPAQDSSL